MSALAPTLQAFFTDRLIKQRNASPHTIAAYRDTWRLLLSYASERRGVAPSVLDLADLDAPLIGGFLDHLETGRGNSIRTRNARLAAICSLFRYVALAHPEHAASIARVLAIGPKRFDRALISYLTEAEVDALLAACDQGTWTGRRDRVMLLLAVQTGLRISELIGLCQKDVYLGAGAYVTCHGKGRKDRITPLTSSTSIFLGTGSPNASPIRPRRCSPTVAVASSAVTPLNTDWHITSARPPAGVRRWPERRSPCTCCGTPPQCDYCMLASIPA